MWGELKKTFVNSLYSKVREVYSYLVSASLHILKHLFRQSGDTTFEIILQRLENPLNATGSSEILLFVVCN